MAIFNGSSRNESLFGTAFADSIYAFGGNDYVEAGAGRDEIDGGTGNDTLYGGDDSDTIFGGSGNDVISGGDDTGDSPIVFMGSTLISFDDPDVLTGGTGNDVFLFDGNDDDHDLITDFRRGSDQLRITDATAADIEQTVITSGPYGPGLLIRTDINGDGDEGLFLRGVTAPLTIGTDIVLV